MVNTFIGQKGFDLATHSEDHAPPELPQFAVFMKVGPHSGMQLREIVTSKLREQSLYGLHYWGYSGTLCHPRRILEHVDQAVAAQGFVPTLILSETRSSYGSSIGELSRYSANGTAYRLLPEGAQLQGAQYALVATNLREVSFEVSMDIYSVVGGKKEGSFLADYMRHRINKACVRLSKEPRIPPSQRTIECAYIADLVSPFAIWLRE